jgi:hypothetical protein
VPAEDRTRIEICRAKKARVTTTAAAHLPNARAAECRDAARIEQSRLMTPRMPSRLGLARKQFEMGSIHKSLDALPHAIGLTAVLATLFHKQTADVLSATQRLPPRCEQTLLRVTNGSPGREYLSAKRGLPGGGAGGLVTLFLRLAAPASRAATIARSES